MSDTDEVAPLIDRLLGGFTTRRAARPANTLVVRAPDPIRSEFRLYRDCKTVHQSDDVSSVVVALLAELNRRAIDSFDTYAAHAAVLDVGGHAIALPAESGHGKTTLTTAAVMSGLGYMSDEALCIDPESELVYPYPRPLLLSADSREILGLEATVVDNGIEGAVSPAEIGRVVADPIPLGHVVFPEYGHDAARLEAVDAGTVMAELLRMSFNNYKDPEGAFRLAASVAGRVGGWRLTYGDPFEAAKLMASELA